MPGRNQIRFFAGRYSCLLGLAVLTLPVLSGQSAGCDPHLLQPPGNPYGYRLRGDRCEGIYVQEVSGAPLSIVSWTSSFEDYDVGSHQPLMIEWDSPANGSVRLRALGLRRRLYYRMDAVRPAGKRSYAWPSDLLAAIGISKSELGIVCSTRTLVDRAEREVYLPLRIGRKQKQPQQGTYMLVLVPGVELKEIFLTLTAAGHPEVLKNGTPLGYGYYPAERPIVIPVSGFKGRGIYHLEAGATLRGGGAATAELWLYHPGK